MPEPQDFSTDMNDADMNGLPAMNGLSADDRNLERLLKSLVPRESRLNRDRVMYLAGQASAESATRSAPRRLARWMLPATTVCAACAGLVVGAVLSLRNPVAGNPVADKPVTGNLVTVERSHDVHEASSAAGQLPDGPSANAPSTPQIADRPAANDQRSGLSTDPRTGGSLHVKVASKFPLLMFRDRMLGDRWDDQALAQIDPAAASDGSATDIVKPLSARELFERWIEDEGPDAHRGPKTAL
jgi:hypothetical protein